jgi:hypothetical protein
MWRSGKALWRWALLCAALIGLPAPTLASTNPDGVAVIIGNKGYSEGIPAVTFAHNDAEAMRRYVVEVLGFEAENVIDLRDATQAELISAFGNERNHKGKLWSYLAPDGASDVVVFYSGHGVPGLEDERGYLLPVNADPNQPELNGYPLDLLYKNLGKLKGEARAVTVYLDACFSGGSGGGLVVTETSGILVPYKQPKDVGGLRVLTAAEGDQVASWDKEAKHGLFTRHLLDALHGKADQDRYGTPDGKVTLAEAKAYLDRHMTRAARRLSTPE